MEQTPQGDDIQVEQHEDILVEHHEDIQVEHHEVLNPIIDVNEGEVDVIEVENDGVQQDLGVNDDGDGTTINDLQDGENEGDIDKVGGKRNRKKNSKAHTDFVEATVKGVPKWKCVHCKKHLCRLPGGTTSHLLNHMNRCLQKKLNAKDQKTLQFAPAKSKFEMNPLSDGRYDHLKQREAIAHWILLHEQPFKAVENYGFTFMFKVNLPQFEKISRAMARNDVIKVFEIEKEKLRLILKNIDKISLTTDIWKSKVQKISYMCVTGHFVDKHFQLHKRVLSFMPLPPPHTGVDIFDALIKSTKDWGIEHKVFTISVDNASNNNSALRIAKQTFSKSRKLPLSGKLFHVKCAAHILNLVVQDGLAEIKHIIENVKDSARFINQSESRLMNFSDIVHHLDIPAKKLIIDCPTRWNSTYEMLVEAIKMKDAFPIFAQTEPLYTCCPSSEDWSKVHDVVEVLEVFYEATHVISGTNYPTSNVFLAVIWRVKHVLDEKENHANDFIKNMVKNMKKKFDKYWGSCNLLMSIGAILDPRFKMRLVEFAFNKIYNENEARTNLMIVRDALYDLFFEYVETNRTENRNGGFAMLNRSSVSTTSSVSMTGKSVPSGISMFDDYLNTVEDHAPSKSELDIYLEEGVFRCQDGDSSNFDALTWWKSQELKFNILSKLARDVLAIPISTVASEATFSAGTRVLDPYRANLLPNMVEVLICGADWVRQLHGINNGLAIHDEEEQIDIVLQT